MSSLSLSACFPASPRLPALAFDYKLSIESVNLCEKMPQVNFALGRFPVIIGLLLFSTLSRIIKRMQTTTPVNVNRSTDFDSKLFTVRKMNRSFSAWNGITVNCCSYAIAFPCYRTRNVVFGLPGRRTTLGLFRERRQRDETILGKMLFKRTRIHLTIFDSKKPVCCTISVLSTPNRVPVKPERRMK